MSPHRQPKAPLQGVMRVRTVEQYPSALQVNLECADCGKKFHVWLGTELPKCPCWTRVEEASR